MKYDAIKNTYGDTAIYFVINIYEQDQIIDLFEGMGGYEKFNLMINESVLPIFLHCTSEDNKTIINQIMDIDILDFTINKKNIDYKKIIKELYSKYETE